MKRRLLNLFTSITLSIIVAFAMMPAATFALEEDVTDTSVVEPQDVTYEESPEIDEIDGEEAQTEESTEEAIDTEAKAAAEDETNSIVSAGEDTGALVDTAGYSNKMRIYGIYLHRANGSRVSSDRYGDAVLIESNGKFLLMDTGAVYPIKHNYNDRYPSSLVKTLKSIGVKELDVYISHMHDDHVGGLGDICDNFKVNRLYLPDMKLCEEYITPNSKTKICDVYANNIDTAKRGKAGGPKEIIFLKPSFREPRGVHMPIESKGVSYCPDARTAYEFSVGAVKFEVIGPVGTYKMSDFKNQDGDCGTMEGHYLNNCSLVTIAQCGSFRFLSAGDIEKQEEAALVKEYGYGLNCNMMKASHHGLRTSSTSSFLARVTPKWSFNEDHGFTSGVAAQAKRMKNRGYYFSVLSNRCNFISDIDNGAARIYVDANNNGRIDEKPLTGWVKVTGDKARYQYYTSSGVIKWRWLWMNKSLYYFDINSGFRITGKAVINGVKVEFDKNGKLISHKRPKKVELVSIKAKKNHKIKIKWKKAARAKAYQVYRKTGKNGSYEYIGTYGKKVRSLKDKNGIERGKTYYYKVRAIRYVAGGTMYGPFSKVKKVKAR